ncbi:hypothetical protein [Nocardioides ultimimeridianus]
MDVSEEMREVLDRLRHRKRKDGRDAAAAIRPLDDNRIMMLARYEGQSLPELQVSFQLLPIGTRLYLESVGAITLHDVGDTYFRVDVHEFALDLVAAAVDRQAARRRQESGSLFEKEVARVLSDRFTLKSDSTATPQDLAGAVDVLGTFKAPGRLASVDESTHIGAIEVLDESGHQIRDVRVRYRFSASGMVPVGGKLQLSFVVGLPKNAGGSWRHGRSTVTVADLVSSTPGVVRVKYDKFPTAGLISFTEDPEPNAVAELLDVVADKRH